MKRIQDRLRQLAVIAVVLGLSQAIPRQARADFAYAFAQQTISNLTISPGVVPAGTFTSFAQDATTLDGNGASHSDPMDPVQAFQGGLPMAPGNFFGRYAPGVPPVSPTVPPSFTRSDVLFTSAGGTNSAATVAESFINVGPGAPHSETGQASLTASSTFNLATSSALTIAYNFANYLYVSTSGPGTAAKGNFGFSITIHNNATGLDVFKSQTNTTNGNASAPPTTITDMLVSGAEAVISPLLTAGTSYTITFSVNSSTSVTAVPEPGSLSLGLLAIGGLIPIGYRMKRRQID